VGTANVGTTAPADGDTTLAAAAAVGVVLLMVRGDDVKHPSADGVNRCAVGVTSAGNTLSRLATVRNWTGDIDCLDCKDLSEATDELEPAPAAVLPALATVALLNALLLDLLLLDFAVPPDDADVFPGLFVRLLRREFRLAGVVVAVASFSLSLSFLGLFLVFLLLLVLPLLLLVLVVCWECPECPECAECAECAEWAEFVVTTVLLSLFAPGLCGDFGLALLFLLLLTVAGV
jgi:hypothetical protein